MRSPFSPAPQCLKGAPPQPLLSAQPWILGRAPKWGKFLAAWRHGEALGGSISADAKLGPCPPPQWPDSFLLEARGPVFTSWPRASRATQNQSKFCLMSTPTKQQGGMAGAQPRGSALAPEALLLPGDLGQVPYPLLASVSSFTREGKGTPKWPFQFFNPGILQLTHIGSSAPPWASSVPVSESPLL